MPAKVTTPPSPPCPLPPPAAAAAAAATYRAHSLKCRASCTPDNCAGRRAGTTNLPHRPWWRSLKRVATPSLCARSTGIPARRCAPCCTALIALVAVIPPPSRGCACQGEWRSRRRGVEATHLVECMMRRRGEGRGGEESGGAGGHPSSSPFCMCQGEMDEFFNSLHDPVANKEICDGLAMRCGTPQHGLSSKKMALITSDYGIMCYLRI